MSDFYTGEIRFFPYIFAPYGWLACDGSLVSIAEYDVLYALIGTYYGGDGQTTFGVPDLRGRVPVHQGWGPGLSQYSVGQLTGTETVTLLSVQLPVHNHYIQASAALGTTTAPANAVLSQFPAGDGIYSSNATGGTTRAFPTAIAAVGGTQPHENCAPTLAMTPCIAWSGTFPSRN